MTKVDFGEYSAFDSPRGIRFMQNKKLVSETAIPVEVQAFLRTKLASQPQDAEVPVAPTEGAKFPMPSPEELTELRAKSLEVKPELQVTEDFPEPPVATTKDEPAMSEYLDSVSIHTASVQDIAQALYDRFGVYTVYLNQFPQTDEVNPLTGASFTKYHQGIAYQALIAARAQGILNRPTELARVAMDEGRRAHEEVDQSFVQSTPKGTQMATYTQRTSPDFSQLTASDQIVHITDPTTGEVRVERRAIPQANNYTSTNNNQRYDASEDEMIVEPKFGQQIIRPNW